MGCCAHCGHVKFGIDKGSQRYKCKSCKRSFTEYTGTWFSRFKNQWQWTLQRGSAKSHHLEK